MPQTKYQTLTQFYNRPFGSPVEVDALTKLRKNYESYVNENKIRLEAICQVETSYFYHIKVPSESQKSSTLGQYEYDVIIRFFTSDASLQKANNLRGYYVQFFSNSPSFMYTYAYVYKKAGYLIEALYNKLDPDYIDVPPTKTNPNLKKSYDKSIYFACRFLVEREFNLLSKTKVSTKARHVSEEVFFRNVSDFRSVKLDQELMQEEHKLQKNLSSKDMKKIKRNVFKIAKKMSTHTGDVGLLRGGIRVVQKRNGSNHIVAKKGARRTTRKRR